MAGLYVKLSAVAAAWASLSGVSLYGAFCVPSPIWMRVLSGLIALVFLILALVYIWIFIQRPCPHQSLFTVSIHFLTFLLLGLKGKLSHSEILKTCKDPMMHQRRLWREILDLNVRTAYADDHGLRGMPTLGDLRKQHPLSGYERFRPYVERMMEGERNVLVDGIPDSYTKTTGTTGTSKYIPQKNKIKQSLKFGSLVTYISNYHYPPTNPLAKIVYLYVAPEVLTTKSGSIIDTTLTISDDHECYLAQFSTPACGFRIGAMHEAFYVHLLFALKDPDLGHFIVTYLHFLESAMKLLEKEWKNLTRDIERGTLKADLNLLPAIRESLTKELQTYGPDPARAAQLRGEFEKGFVGIIKRIWPKVPVLVGIDCSGNWPRLSKTYAKGLPLLSTIYSCSESVIGVYPGPKFIDKKGYLPVAKLSVFEFIMEEEMSSSQPRTFFLNELEQGQNYEVVITQPFGLYRYRMGDVIQVIGFHEEMPVIDFLYRTGQMLNVRYEKLDQRVVSDSIRSATAKWTGRTLIEFAVAESTLLNQKCSIYEPNELMPYYIFFLEMNDPSQPLSDAYTSMIDTELRNRNISLERLRGQGAFSRPRVHVVRPGAFAELERYLLANTGASANQYKVPRKLRTIAMLEVMLENLVS